MGLEEDKIYNGCVGVLMRLFSFSFTKVSKQGKPLLLYSQVSLVLPSEAN